MSKYNRHPKRTWFGDTPVRTLADAEAEAKQDSRVGAEATGKTTVRQTHWRGSGGETRLNQFASDRRQRTETGAEVQQPTLDTSALAAIECQQQAQSLFADRLLQPEEVRAKYPRGWLRASYVPCPRLARVRADGVPVLFDVVERAEGGQS